MTSLSKNRLIAFVIVAAALGTGVYAWTHLRASGPGEGFASGNGRIEATEIDVAAKLGGRIKDIVVKEGDFVTAGQILAHMQVDTLEAMRAEAVARQQQAVAAVASAGAMVAVRDSDKQAVLALLAGARALQQGSVTVLGGDMRNQRHRDAVCPRIAYMPQGLGKNLYPTLSVEENLQFFARLFGHNAAERRRRIDSLTDSTGLRPFWSARPANFRAA